MSIFKNLINSKKPILTEGAIIERLSREYKLKLDDYIANSALIYDNSSKVILQNIYKQYIDIAYNHNTPIMIFAPTWRLSNNRIMQSDYHDKNLNYDCCKFLDKIKYDYHDFSENIFIGGLLGCKGDAYKPDEALDAINSFNYHKKQISKLNETNIDYLFAATLPAFSEAYGIAKAMALYSKPYIISFIIDENGCLLDGTNLSYAIQKIDNEISQAPICYMINCVHPTTLKKALKKETITYPEITERLIGIQGNTSKKTPNELNDSIELDTQNAELFTKDIIELYENYQIRILGGCCGTDQTHIQSIANFISKL
ncbi:MAG: homocysteine S-methyltransferase family protein [bacterium]